MRQVPLARLTRLFAWIGLTSLGGGRAAYIFEEFVARRRWLSAEEFVPGPDPQPAPARDRPSPTWPSSSAAASGAGGAPSSGPSPCWPPGRSRSC